MDRSVAGAALGPVVLVIVGALLGHGVGGAAAPAGTGTAAAAGVAPTDTPLEGVARAAGPNDTVQHENPESVSEPGDLAMLRRWLGKRMGETVVDCNRGLRVGNYDACDDLDREFPAYLDRFVDIADETGGERDDAAAQRFREARRQQQEFEQQVREFRETRAAYEAARAAGDDERARRLARRLNELAANASATGRRLAGLYRAAAAAGLETEAAVEDITAVTENVTETTESIARDEFRNTTVTATPRSPRASFLDPLVVSGRVVTANGSAVADQPVVLAATRRTVRTTTNATGGFVLRLRPTRLPLDAERLPVRVEPRAASLYRGNRTTVPVTVRQVTPTVAATTPNATVGFGDRVAVTGRVAVEGEGVPGLPVAARVGGERRARTRTGGDGRFAAAFRVPAGLPAGRQELRVGYYNDSTAVGAATATVTVTVEETATTLAVTATPSAGGERRLAVRGRLTTADGEPVGDQPVTLTLDGRAVRTVRTAANGTVAATLAVPASLADGDAGTLTARFDGGGTNLESSRASATVTVGAADSSGSLARRLGRVTWWEWLAGAGLLAAALWRLGVAARLRRRLGDTPADEHAPAARAGEPGGTEAPDGPGAGAAEPSPLAAARETLDAGDTDRAVELAYAAVRRRLGEDIEGAAAMTHWEFLAACRADGLDADSVGAVEEVTEAYEAAAFAPRGPDAETAERAVASAATLL